MTDDTRPVKPPANRPATGGVIRNPRLVGESGSPGLILPLPANRCHECGALDVELGWAYVCRQCWPGLAADFTEPF
jgi:hypothetical protein